MSENTGAVCLVAILVFAFCFCVGSCTAVKVAEQSRLAAPFRQKQPCRPDCPCKEPQP